jgi:hypothetical protein
MTRETVGAVASGAAMAVVILTVSACGTSEPSATARQAAVATLTSMTARGIAGEPPRGVVEDCSTRSEASFPGAYSDPRNLVVGPLALIGAAHTPARVVRELGGNKFPALVEAGHRVTVELSRRTRRVAGLAYGPLPQGEVHLREAHRVVTFAACPPGGPSGSTADGTAVTFWSGFVLTASPRCVSLRVWVDDEPSPRLADLRLGPRRCP